MVLPIVTVTLWVFLAANTEANAYTYVLSNNGFSYGNHYYNSYPYLFNPYYGYQQPKQTSPQVATNRLVSPLYASSGLFYQNPYTVYPQQYQTPQSYQQIQTVQPYNQVQAPVQTPAQAPVQAPVQARKFERLQQQPVQVPQQTLVQEPVQKPVQKPVEEEEDEVLDFSSGSAQVVENTATQVEEVSDEAVEEKAKDGFSIFKGIFNDLGLEKEFANVGNLTIFSPENQAFDKLGVDIDTVDRATLRRWMLKHFVKGSLRKQDIPAGELQTIGGEFVTITKDEKGRMRVFSNSGESKAKITNIKTKWGMIHVLDTVLT